MPESPNKKGIFKVIVIALTVSILGIGILGWQYRRLEQERLPALEEKIEQNSAQDVLRRFLETKADILLTERAVEQKNRGEFVLENDIKYYEILEVVKLAPERYRFRVRVGNFTEMIILTKILGSYYIDSIDTAG